MDEASGLSIADRAALVAYHQAQTKADLADSVARTKTLTALTGRLAKLAATIKREADADAERAAWAKATAGLTAAQVAEAVAAWKAQSKR